MAPDFFVIIRYAAHRKISGGRKIFSGDHKLIRNVHEKKSHDHKKVNHAHMVTSWCKMKLK